MSDASVIREYLVALGFKVDPASFKKFEGGLKVAAEAAAKMASVVTLAATAVDVAVVKVASSLDSLYWASQRIGSSAGNIRAYEYAFSQLGGTAAGARQTLEGLALFIRSNPGSGGWLGAIGVQVRDAKGNLRDTEQVAIDLGRRLAAMPQYRAIRYAQMLGIDYNSLLAMERGPSGRTAQYGQFAKSIGVDLTQSAAGANRFMTTVRELRAELGLLLIKIGVPLIERWGPALRSFMVWTGQHSKEIGDRIGGWVNRIARFGEALFRFGMGVLKLLTDLDEATGGWSTGIIAVLAALGASGAGGLIGALATVSPLLAGIVTGIVALVAGLALLYADFSKWKSGGKSLIDWGPWADQVSQLVTDVRELAKALADLGNTLSVSMGPGVKSLFSDLLRIVDLNVKALGHMARAMDALLHGNFALAMNEAGGWIKDMALAQMTASTAPGRAFSAQPDKPSGSFGQMQKLFESFGWTPEQAAGLAANAQRESGINPSRTGDNGAAYGLMQWHADRQAQFRQMMGKDIRGSTLEEQAMFANWELRRGRESGAGRRLAGARTAMEAGAIVSQYYERPANGMFEAARRGQLAEAGLHAPLGTGGHGGVHLSNKTDIHIDGARDPHAVGRETARAQTHVWSAMLRDTKGAVR